MEFWKYYNTPKYQQNLLLCTGNIIYFLSENVFVWLGKYSLNSFSSALAKIWRRLFWKGNRENARDINTLLLAVRTMLLLALSDLLRHSAVYFGPDQTKWWTAQQLNPNYFNCQTSFSVSDLLLVTSKRANGVRARHCLQCAAALYFCSITQRPKLPLLSPTSFSSCVWRLSWSRRTNKS